jgi:hypothetical protein
MALLATTEAAIGNTVNEERGSAILTPASEMAPLVQRLSSHRDRIYMAIIALESERFELQSRRDYLRQQLAAVDEGFAIHIRDIEATLRMYEAGLKSLDAAEN